MTLLTCLALSTTLHAQDMVFIHASDNVTDGALISEIRGVTISSDSAFLNFDAGDTVIQYAMAQIDSISFGESIDTVYINYNGSSASVLNPLAFEGVSVDVNGAAVTIDAAEEASGISYKLSGTTTNGSFKIYSEKKFSRFIT